MDREYEAKRKRLKAAAVALKLLSLASSLQDCEGYLLFRRLRLVKILKLVLNVFGNLFPPPPQIPKFYNVMFEGRPAIRRGGGYDVWGAAELDHERFFRLTGETPLSLGRIVDDLTMTLLSRRPNSRDFMPTVADVCACFAQRHIFLVRDLR